MFKCSACNRAFKTKHSVRAHWRFCPVGSEEFSLQQEDVKFDEMNWKRKRLYLIEKAEHKCTICGFSKTRPDGRGILEIDHIDSDHTNNSIENLRVLCPNCHALTPNFRNWGRKSTKTSKRFRAGNKGFETFRTNTLSEKQQRLEDQNNLIVSVIMDTFDTGLIDYRKRGWIGKLNDLLTKNYSMMFKQKTIGRKVREILPDFYKQNCWKKIY